MTKQDFLKRHKITRSAIKEDMFGFALPALVIFTVGLVVSGRDGYDGLVDKIWSLVKQPESLSLLSVQNIVGLLLFVVGLTIALIAVGTIKQFYASTLIIRQDHQLITHGIYRFIRHPIYFGVIIAVMGVPAYALSLYGFLTMLALIPLFLNRIRIEEKLLIEEFGDVYQLYRASSKKLIPFVY